MRKMLGILFNSGREVVELDQYIKLPEVLPKRLETLDMAIVVYAIKITETRLGFWGWDQYSDVLEGEDYNQNTLFVPFEEIKDGLESLVNGY